MTKYAIATRSMYGPEGRSKAQQNADHVSLLYKAQPGFEHAHFMVYDEEAGEYGGLSVFDTKEHAEAADRATMDKREVLAGALGVIHKERRIVELYEP